MRNERLVLATKKSCYRPLYIHEERFLKEANVSFARFEVQGYKFSCKEEQVRLPRVVRIGAFQNELPVTATSTIKEMRAAVYKMAESAITAAAYLDVNVFCFQEAWSEYKAQILL